MMSGRIVQNNPQRHFADEPQGLVVSSKVYGNSDVQGNALECSRQPVRTAEHLRACKGELASCVCGSNPGLQVSPPVLARDLPQHGRPQFHDEVGHDLGPSHVWRRATNSMDSSGPAPPDRRAGGEQGDRDPDGQEGWHGLAKGNHGAEQGEPQKVRLDPPCADQPPAVGPSQCHDPGHPEGGHGEVADGDPRRGWRLDGVREILQSNVPRCEGERAQVLRVDQGHQQGGEHFDLHEAVRRLPHAAREDREEAVPDQGQHREGHGQERIQDRGGEAGGGERASTHFDGKLLDGSHGEPADPVGGDPDRGSEGAEGGALDGGPPEDRGHLGCEDGHLPQGLPMSQVAASALAHKSQLVVPHTFEELTGSSRVEFMEIACEPDSLLTSAVQARTGRSDAACRSSLWRGHDLATTTGLSQVLEQIYALQPKRVWVSPPCGPYSPLQNVNQRSPAQIRELKAKRATAQRIYDSTLEIVKVCLQLGIHVTVDLAERCEAWRLPALQKLRFDMGLYTAVTKGCAVGLKGQDGALMQKGWRIVTSHARLAEVMHKPCSCPTNYKHAKCEGKNATKSACYTKEYVRLAIEALSREGNFQRVVEECSGKSSLPQGFGLGMMCTCPTTSEGSCGSCMLSSRVEAHEPEQAQAFMTQQAKEALHNQVLELQCDPRKHTLKDLECLLKEHSLTNLGRTRRNTTAAQDYQVFGSYAYGNQYGLTSRTRNCPQLCMYINQVLRKVMPKHLKWTSFALNHGTMTPIHVDCNNDAQYPNGSVGFGNYKGGELWVEGSEQFEGREGRVSVRENSQGEVLEGREFDLRLRPLVFPPKRRHGTCDWEGDRWVLTVFVSRNWQHVGPQEVEELRGLGFPTPPTESEEAYPAEHQPQSPNQAREKERIRKQLYLLHCATGHSNPRHMEQALRKRGADALTLQLAKDFSCPVCQEKSKPQPRNLSALEPLPPTLATISADVGHWVNPHTHESVQFMLVIDEGSRFRTARILSQGSRQSPNAQTCLHYLQEGWVQYFGLPRCLRLDPAGVFRSTAVEEWCDKHGIHLDVVPGEAHWKVGTCENAVQGVKNVMDKLSLHWQKQ